MRTNYVLIDFENVQPESLTILEHDYFRVLIFVGANQTKLTFDMAEAVQRMGNNASYIKIAGNGSNALDFHIAFYIGQLAATNPSAFFHIVSKDTGFDPLIKHLKAEGILAGRVKSVADIPLAKVVSSKSPNERVGLIVSKLNLQTNRPRTVKTLSNTIAGYFQKQLTEQDVEKLIETLTAKKKISVSGTKVTYSL